MRVLCVILILESYIIGVVLANTGARFTDTKNNKKIAAGEDDKYVSLKGLTEVQCVGHCTLTDDCHSVNHHSDDQICLVIDEPLEGDSHLIDAHGWKYFKKTRITKEDEISTKNNFEITNAFKPNPNKIVNFLPYLKEEWELTFNIIIYGKSDQNKSGIFTMAKELTAQNKLLNIYVITSTDQKIRVYTKEMSYSFKFEYNKWHTIKFTQRSSPINDPLQTHVRSLVVDGMYVNKMLIKLPEVSENLICFAGSPHHLALNGRVRNLTFKQDGLPHRNIRPKHNYISNNIDPWYREWYVRFTLVIHSIDFTDSSSYQRKGYHNVIHFTTGVNDGSMGTRIVSAFIKDTGTTILGAEYMANGQWKQIFVSYTFDLDREYRIEFKSFESQNNPAANIIQFWVDGLMNPNTVTNFQPIIQGTVIIYVSDPWYKPADATLFGLEYGPLE
eukprot:TCONS_00052083-protein